VATQHINYITGDAAFTIDRNGVIISWNAAAEKEFGYPASEVIGRRCWQLLAGRDSFDNRYCCEKCPLMEMAVRNESVHSTEIEFRTANDGRKKFKLSCIALSGYPGDGLLMHICHKPIETTEIAHNTGKHKSNGDFQPAGLTKRELQVLELMAEGNTTREIASIMCISQATARNHIQHTLDKLHVHSRLEAVVVGQRLDII
jgi:PAS domain S-box-containing protein